MREKYDRDGIPIKPIRRKSKKKVSGAYALVAPEYRRAGWWPVPVAGKILLATDVAGYKGIITDEKVEELKRQFPRADTALLLEGSVGIDVDHRDNKHGAFQLQELIKELGPLPPTFSITSRGPDSPSRIYLFRVESDCRRRGKLAKDIEVIHRFQRYAVTFPTIHPDTGQRYEWYSPEGEQLRTWLPYPSELPLLPEAWDEYLKTSSVSTRCAASGGLFGGDLVAWENWLNYDSPTPPVRDLIDDIEKEEHIGHDELFWFVVRVHESRHLFFETGVGHAYVTLKQKYFAETNDRNPVKELGDIVRWVIGAEWAPREINEPPLSQIYSGLIQGLTHKSKTEGLTSSPESS